MFLHIIIDLSALPLAIYKLSYEIDKLNTWYNIYIYTLKIMFDLYYNLLYFDDLLE
jgi:hypothetical protein